MPTVPAHTTPWMIRYEGSGYSLSEGAATEHSAYLRARAQAAIAAEGKPVAVTLRIGGQDARLAEVGRVWVLRLDENAQDYVPHSHSWFKSEPSPHALTPLPADF
jgi:hypothetical protein